jgi:creatinine amidohydrolase
MTLFCLRPSVGETRICPKGTQGDTAGRIVSEREGAPVHYLERMTYPQVERLATRTELALLPVGPPEAHGPHLPVGTDLMAASELCERAARDLAARGVECVIAPLLSYCLAEVASPFPGTITVRAEVVAALVADICRGLVRSGFRRTLIVSGHAEEENLAALRAATEEARQAGALAEVSGWYGGALPRSLHLLREDHPEYDLHAGEWETALVLLRAPELVDRGSLEALPPNWATRNISERRAGGARTFPELGAPEAYCGDPRKAVPATAESLYAALGQYVAEEAISLHRS